VGGETAGIVGVERRLKIYYPIMSWHLASTRFKNRKKSANIFPYNTFLNYRSKKPCVDDDRKFLESKIKGGHVRRASGPWETRRSAHVPHKTSHYHLSSTACLQAKTVIDKNAAPEESEIRPFSACRLPDVRSRPGGCASEGRRYN